MILQIFFIKIEWSKQRIGISNYQQKVETHELTNENNSDLAASSTSKHSSKLNNVNSPSSLLKPYSCFCQKLEAFHINLYILLYLTIFQASMY